MLTLLLHGFITPLKIKCLPAMVLKLNLTKVKVFDKVCWLYLIPVLINIGLNLSMVNWIIGCVTTVFYVVILNGSASSFFKHTIGLKQGCPLSPYLLLLVTKGLEGLDPFRECWRSCISYSFIIYGLCTIIFNGTVEGEVRSLRIF